jgi:hypothetical protein
MTDSSIFARDLPANIELTPNVVLAAGPDLTAITDLLDELYPEYDRRALAGVARQLAGQLDDAIPAMPVVREATARWLQREGIVPFDILYAVPSVEDGDPDSEVCLCACVDIRVTRDETRSILVMLSSSTNVEGWRVVEVAELP